MQAARRRPINPTQVLLAAAALLPVAVALMTTAALAGEPAAGWRELRFGQSEQQVAAKILDYRTHSDREWEQTGGTAIPLVDVAGKVIQVDLDSKRFHHWMIGQLDDGASTVRAWFDGGKLFAVQVLGTIDLEAFIAKASAAYGSQPERATFRFSDATSTGKPSEAKDVPVAVWKGAKTTAIIFQTTGWGPELFIVSNAGIAAVKKSVTITPTPSAAESATRF